MDRPGRIPGPGPAGVPSAVSVVASRLR